MEQGPPPNLIPFGADANCTLDLCPLEWSILRYQPSIPANALFIGLFGLGMVIHLGQGIYYKTWTFANCMAAGCILEIVGYVGRLMLHDNPFSFEAFLMQISEFEPCLIPLIFKSANLTAAISLHHYCSRLLLLRHLHSALPNVSLCLVHR